MLFCAHPQCEEELDQQPHFVLLTGVDSSSKNTKFDADHSGHVLCAECFGQMQALRGCAPCFDCPYNGCNAKVMGHYCVKRRAKATRTGLHFGKEKEPGRPCFVQPPDPLEDPIRHYKSLSSNEKRNNIIVSVGFPDAAEGKVTGRTRILTVMVPHRQSADYYSDDIKAKLVALMRVLHHVVSDKNDAEQPRVNIGNVSDIDQIILNDESMLLQAVICLGLGKTKRDILGGNPPYFRKEYGSKAYVMSQLRSFWVAAEMIRRGGSSTPGLLQEVIARLLRTQNATAVNNILTSFRLSASRQWVQLGEVQKVNDMLLRGWDLSNKKYWLVMITYDNLGWRILGAKAGYDQYVFILAHFISPKQLEGVGFYKSRLSMEPPLDRKRRIWKDINHNYTARSILPKVSHYDALAKQVYGYIDSILGLINNLPTVEQAKDMLDSLGGEPFECDMRLPYSYGSRARLDYPDDVTGQGVRVEQEEEVAEEEAVLKTMYNLPDQYIQPDVPMHADLNKTATVQNILVGALDIRRNFLSQRGFEIVSTDEAPIMEDLGIHTGGDGSPCNTAINLERRNGDAYRDVTNHAGGFHNLLNLFQKIGTRFGPTHLSAYLHPFRSSDKKKEWFLCPGDPNQILDELPEMMAAHFVSASRHVASMTNAPVSPQEVDDFMLERAKEHDHCMIVLMWLRFCAIADMMRDSERENDPELYRAAASLAMLLYVGTNATNYVRMGLYYWVRWETNSEADKVLYDNFFFTKKTVNGRYVWIDRFEEWYNRDVREYLGKHKRRNQASLCLRTALLMRERKMLTAGFSTMSKDEASLDKEIPVTRIFCHELLLVHQYNLWGVGPVRVGRKGNLWVPSTFTDPEGQTILNKEILFEVSRAEKNLSERFKNDYLNPDGVPTKQSEKSVSIKMTEITAEKLKDERDLKIARMTSTNKSIICAKSDKKFMHERIKTLVENFKLESEFPRIPPYSKNKDILAEYLAKVHLYLATNVDRWKEDIITALNDEYASQNGFADRAQKEIELNRPFYKFSEEARAEFLVAYQVDSGEDHATEEDGHDSDDDPIPLYDSDDDLGARRGMIRGSL